MTLLDTVEVALVEQPLCPVDPAAGRRTARPPGATGCPGPPRPAASPTPARRPGRPSAPCRPRPSHRPAARWPASRRRRGGRRPPAPGREWKGAARAAGRAAGLPGAGPPIALRAGATWPVKRRENRSGCRWVGVEIAEDGHRVPHEVWGQSPGGDAVCIPEETGKLPGPSPEQRSPGRHRSRRRPPVPPSTTGPPPRPHERRPP
jgi:hypothetical protein